ncbi:MAG: hypothetical protein LBV04_02125 [Deferribacteraceae bacterium]|nr:hypothetical protein [Deferribacteraceae bacterium]
MGRYVLALCVYIVLLSAVAAAQGVSDAVWQYREPQAWGAIYKYCIACHGADVIDQAELTAEGWDERIYKCQLRMVSRGYPQPTASDKAALSAFLVKVTPVHRQPPVYFWPPPRGGIAYP